MEAKPFRWGGVWALGFGMLGVSLLWQLYDVYLPLFLQSGRPDFGRGAGTPGFGLGTTATGFIMTLDNLAALLILPTVGVLSDRLRGRGRWGRRKPFLLVGAPVAALAFAALPFTVGGPLVVFIALAGIVLLAMDLFRTPLTALLPDLAPDGRRSPASGVLSLMGGIGGVLAFAIGGALFRVSPAAPFAFGAAGMLAGVAVVLLLVREPAPPAGRPAEVPGVVENLRALVRDRDRSAFLLLGAIFTWSLGVSTLPVFFPSFTVKEFGLDSGQATQLMAFFGLAIVAGSVPAGLLGARLGRRAAILTGLVLLIGLVGSIYAVQSLPLLRGLLVAMGLCWSLVIVNALPMALEFAPPARSGAHTGLFFLATQLAACVGPTAAGAVLQMAGTNYRYLFLYVPCTMVLACGMMLGVRGRGQGARAPAKVPAATVAPAEAAP